MSELMGWPGPMTETQYLAWQEWFELDFNRTERDKVTAYQIRMCQAVAGGTHEEWKLKRVFREPLDTSKMTNRERRMREQCAADLDKWRNHNVNIEATAMAAAIGAKRN